MGAFFLVSKAGLNERTHELVCSQLLEQFKLQGFSQPKVLRTQHTELFLYKKLHADNENYVVYENGDFCACAGTLLYKDEIGSSALHALYEGFIPEKFSPAKLFGAFCVIIKRSSNLYIFLDQLGIYKIYRNSQGTIWSSSLLAIVNSLQEKTINTQAVYEYIFQGATYGGDTVFKSVEIVDCDYLYQLDSKVHPIARQGCLSHPQVSLKPVEALLVENLTELRKLYNSIAKCFDNRLDTSLSGGYDSRLTLTLLKEQGVSPRVHVYGRSVDADVQIALAIARGEGLNLEHIDKSAYPKLNEEAFAQVVRENYYIFDGCPTDGIFNNGADLETRKERSVSDALMLNGGGGEIYRNFFYLPDRNFNVQEVLWTFYSLFDPKLCTQNFSEREYHYSLGSKIKKTLNIDGERLTRAEVELIYPLFRCRYWMGKNNSTNNRIGYALTPFIDCQIVKTAVRIPLRYKNFGKFEASLISKVNPQLAGYNSAYGHNFLQAPGWKHILADYLTYIRPPRLQRYSYRVKSRRLTHSRPYWLSVPYIKKVINHEFPYMREFYAVEKTKDNAQFNRLCTLEYLFQNTCAEHE